MPVPSTAVAEFDSAWAKWARGCVHAQELLGEISRRHDATDGLPFEELRSEYDPRKRKVVFRAYGPFEAPLHWQVILGDVASNFRSALDHIAWALVQRGSRATTLTRSEKSSVYFPIAGDRTVFAKDVSRKLPGARRADLAAVRSVQPYQRGKTRVPWHCLKLLDEMVKLDKHRSITTLGVVPQIVECTGITPIDCELRGEPKGHRAPLASGGIVALVPVRKIGPAPDVELHGLRFSWQVTAHPRLPLDQWVHLTTMTVARLLMTFSEPPTTLVELGLEGDFLDGAHADWDRMRMHWAGAHGIPALG
jgi:hypothetical protein